MVAVADLNRTGTDAVAARIGSAALAFDERHFDELYEVNVKSLFHLVHALVPLMRVRRSGAILHTGSTIGRRSRPGLTWYGASQAAACVLARSLAVELGGDGISVNVISPATGDTGLRGDSAARTTRPKNVQIGRAHV